MLADTVQPVSTRSSALQVGTSELPRQFDVRMTRPVLIEVLLTPNPGWWAALGSIMATTLPVSGGATSHVSGVRQRRAAARLPHGTLESVPEARHRVHSKHLDRFCELVLPVLTQQ